MHRILSRKKDARRRLVKNLLTSLVLFESITTTAAKGKTLKSQAQKLLHAIKDNALTVQRELYGMLAHRNAVKKAMEQLRSKEMRVRLYHLPARAGDGAMMTLVRLEKITPSQSKTADAVEKHAEAVQQKEKK